MASLLEATGLFKRYRMADTELEVLRGIDFSVAPGEVVAIVGPSGVRPSAGSVRLNAVDVFSLSDADLARFRNQYIGFVFQFHHLLPDFTAQENVMMPLMIQGQPVEPCRERADELLHRVGLSHRVHHLPAELSGGESQRVAVARALATRPKVVLADEPSGNLDVERSAELHDMMWELVRDQGQAFVIVTHDLSLSERADRVIRMEDGRVVVSP